MIGLDCLAPELAFDAFIAEMPNLRSLMQRGIWGPLESTIPPITVPAWMCMMTGRDPGTLGIYGFRNRRDHSYDGLSFANSRMVKEEAVWDIIGRQGKRSILIGVPLTYPPPVIDGIVVADFMTPTNADDLTFPRHIADEINAVDGPYVTDVRDYRTDDRAGLLTRLKAMTHQRFAVARKLMTTHPWDLFTVIEMGADRLHHAFWRYHDPQHPLHEPDSPFRDTMREYYALLDCELGATLREVPEDALVLVVSDHGAKRMDGGICLNDWLRREGWLTLLEEPEKPTKFSPANVDWSRTRAWGDGGYYGRVFLNVEGREPNGIIRPSEYNGVRAELAEKLEALGDETGQSIGTRVHLPERVYTTCRNVPPDLITYFGNLNWRSVGSVGNPSVWTHENDTGPDDANHSQHGIAVIAGPGVAPEGRRDGMSIYDIAPTILSGFGLAAPVGMGRRTLGGTPAHDVYTADEEEEIARRLEDLGYL